MEIDKRDGRKMKVEAKKMEVEGRKIRAGMGQIGTEYFCKI